MFMLSEIREALRAHRPDTLPPADAIRGRAAVAMVLAGPPEDLSLCFIRRATHPADPWSGQMALPGGRADGASEDMLAAAVREAREEVGVRLASEHRLGALSEMPIPRVNGVLSPFVFYLAGDLPSLVPCAREVAAAYWIPLSHLWDRDNRTTLDWGSRRHAAIDYRGEVIWGLTLRVLESFARVLGGTLDLEEG